MENRVKFKIGEIEFEAEGSADIVERERSVFLNAILPVAVDAIVQTRGAEKAAQYIEAVEQPTMYLSTNNTAMDNDSAVTCSDIDFSRTSLASFLTQYGNLSEQDFALISAYYDEKKNGVNSFSSDNIKQYYADARRPKYSNVSELLKQLAQKGFIMDDPSADKKIPKKYILTDSGIKYVESYKPKEECDEKPRVKKQRPCRKKTVSEYSSLCADDLNLKNYPDIKSQNSFKKQMLLLLYIVTKEGKGESFSLADIQYLMTDMLGLPATVKQIGGIFDKNRIWFKSEQDPNNKKAYKRKLLQGAKDFAQSIIDSINN